MPVSKRAFRFELWNGGTLLHTAHVCTPDDVGELMAQACAYLRAVVKSGACGAVTIAVHQQGEACDHEQGGG